MKGDFSHWQFDPNENLSGVLQQQGRVLLDRDWNEQSRITAHWNDRAGADVIGAGIAAVPVLSPEGFQVTQAVVAGIFPDQRIELRVRPGRLWADGILCYLPPNVPGSAAPVLRVADYLQPPVDATPGSIATLGPGVRDAVILEVSREELNAFQVPDRLIEPALGGPDTTERVHLRLAFRLFRLEPGETCLSILGDLADDPADKGRLTVQLQPTVVTPGDCPVVSGGGYTGLEHHLYRIEFAAVNPAQVPSFKWSQFNGGLVGRGQFLAAPDRIRITANHAAILNSGLSSFYCEVLTFDATRGVWSPSFGAEVTLNNDELVVGTVRLGTFGASANTVFFRLWNGLEPVADFTDSVTPQELLDGIQLVLDPATPTNYAPGDYWTFPVRAGEITNPAVLIDDQPPFGPAYHRVPIAEIEWGALGMPVVPPALEDCRRRFRPLTRLDTCCTVRVGDGVTSLGDFTSIQAAIDSLPAAGGMVCILPGVYREAVRVENRQNITLSGCGPRTRWLAPTSLNAIDAVLTVRGGSGITVESLAIEASPVGRGILAQGRNPFSNQAQVALGPIRGLVLQDLEVTAAFAAAIRADYVEGLTVQRCAVHMTDTHCLEHAVVVLADDALLEHNTIEVAATRTANDPAVPGGFLPGVHGRGGLHLRSLSDRVRVIDNLIRGGSGNGITLGSIVWYFDDGQPVPPEDEPPEPPDDPCEPGRPIDIGIDPGPQDAGEGVTVRRGSGGPLYDLRIERNRIHDMGSNGIAVAGFFDLSAVDEFISVVNLDILGNDIRRCLRRAVTPPSEGLEAFQGYGGIALADVENLVVHDNAIVDNGADHLDPVCGVFVLHGEGVDLVRNRIVNNGARTAEPASGARRGQRGGVVIRFAIPPTVSVRIGRVVAPMQNGVPAARLHNNIVSVPLGRALVLGGVGPMSIVANQLTSQGVAPLSVDVAGFLAATVQIMNLGISNELYLQLFLFAALAQPNAAQLTTGNLVAASQAGRPGLDDATVGRLLANGQVLFNDNQVNLDLLARGLSLAFTSVLILTLDDVGFDGNQCEANLFDDFILTNTLILAMSQRATDNRWKEGLLNVTAWMSAFTLTFLMNTTTDNQATHCIIARGLPTRIVDEHNIVLLHGVLGEDEGFCDGFNEFLPALRKRQG